jgi:RNA 2',3'-cyclic 3'-phosphodiesterase
LFTGIDLGDDVRARAAAMIAELRHRVQQTAPQARVTWIPEERLHLTVRFIGEVGEPLAERIVSALRAPLPLAPFTVAFNALGSFPQKGPPRVIWIGVADGRDAVSRAEVAISERLHRLGIPREDRAYSPHLTLARVREAAGMRAAALFDHLSPRLGETRVDAITLFQSKLSPKGPTYVVLERTPLRTGG